MDLKRLTVDELRACELNILEAIDAYCTRNHIKYWLDKGSLLGAVRHHGFIPWDDDIDIGMLREDYERFSSGFSDESGRYRFISIDHCSDCFYPYGKVMDTYTSLIEDGKYHISVNVDVNVYDNAPSDEKLISKLFKKRDFYRKLSALQAESENDWRPGFKKLLKSVRKNMLCQYPRGYFIKKMIVNAQTYSGMPTEQVGNFLEYGRCVLDKDVFEETISCCFENRDYPIPKQYDKVLRAYYGDYMQLPPEEKRMTHHDFYAVMLQK